MGRLLVRVNLSVTRRRAGAKESWALQTLVCVRLCVCVSVCVSEREREREKTMRSKPFASCCEFACMYACIHTCNYVYVLNAVVRLNLGSDELSGADTTADGHKSGSVILVSTQQTCVSEAVADAFMFGNALHWI